VRGFLEAAARADAAQDVRLLSLLAIGTRADGRQLDRTLDRLSERASGR
jgi:hypothetical protein